MNIKKQVGLWVVSLVLVLAIAGGQFDPGDSTRTRGQGGCISTVVTNSNDSGPGSLRDVITNCSGTITFDMSKVTSPITLTSGELQVTKTLTIQGPGANLLTISGNNASRVFRIVGGVTMTGLTIANGRAQPSVGTCDIFETAACGGGILVTGGLNLSNSTISNNASPSQGGGIYNRRGSLVVTNVTVSGNTANGAGGGIGAIGSSQTTITNSTISDNTGGGLYKISWGGTMSVWNSTISGNMGGGVAYSGEQSLGIHYSTITNNVGGGIGCTELSPYVTNLEYSIVSGNFATDGSTQGADLNADPRYGCRISQSLIGGDARLGPLADNGGPTLTHALLSGSPALDGGVAGNTGTDQRGFSRFVDGPDTNTTVTSDLGAFEAQVSIENIPDKTINGNTQLQFTFNVGGATNITSVTAASSNPGLVPNNPANIAVSGSGSTRTLTINPAANQFGISTIAVTVSSSNNQSMTDAFVLTVMLPDTPSVTNATTNEDTQTSSGLVLSGNGTKIKYFKITGIVNGTLFQNNGTTTINNGDYITMSEGNAGLKFTPAANLFSPAASFGFQAQGATSASDADLISGLATAEITVNPVADLPSVTNATTNVNTQTTSGLVISRNPADGAEVTHFKITNITNGSLFKNDGVRVISNNQFITFAEGNAGLKFTPALDSTANGSFQVQASVNNHDAGPGANSVTATITVSGCIPAVVTNTNDSGSGSLRALIKNACIGSTITFDTAAFNPAAGPYTITLTSGPLVIGKNLMIAGPGASSLTVSGNQADSVFQVFSTTTISNLTIANGKAPPADGEHPYGSGGGVLNRGTLTLANCNIFGNTAPRGGGIGNYSGSLTLNNCNIGGTSPGQPNTSTSSDGGGISGAGSLLMNGGSVVGNSGGGIRSGASLILNGVVVTDNIINGNGGGVAVGGGKADIVNCLIAGNSATAGGGVFNSGGAVAVANSTISGNSGSSGTTGGGGILNSGGSLTLTNGTIANNRSLVGGGISVSGGSVLLRNSIVAGNLLYPSPGTTPTDIFGTIDPASAFNLIGNGGAGGLTDGVNHNKVGVDALLAPLANNGGTSLTHALLAGSPAIDSGSNDFITNPPLSGPPFTDQRGAGFERIVSGTVDIGAFEAKVSVEDIQDQTTNEDTPLSFQFKVGGAVSNITATSSNTALVPNSAANLSVSGSGLVRTLSITPQTDQSGGTTITVTVDDGSGQGIADTFLLTVNGVNDSPSFAKGADQVVNNNEGAQTVANWATNISAGPADESSQTVAFQVINSSNPALFSVAPAISQTGTLTYTPAANQAGTAAITINLKDDGGTSNGGVDTSASRTFNIDVTAVGGSVYFSDASCDTTESSGCTLVTVKRTGDLTRAVTVDYATSDDNGLPCETANGVATPKCDFTTALGTLSFAAGEDTKVVTIQLSQDSFVGGPETFSVFLSNPRGGAALANPSAATITIADDSIEPATNAIDDTGNFVRQHYHDFLNREPDQSGWDFWSNQVTPCGNDAACFEVKRINVSAAFFLSIEFQQTGYLVERMYKVAYGDAEQTSTFGGNHQLPVPIVRFDEFLKDTQRIGQGVIVLQPHWEEVLENNKQLYAMEFVQTSRFTVSNAFPTTLTPAQFVDKLNQNAGDVLSASEHTTAIDLFGGATDTRDVIARAQAVRQVAEDPDLYSAEFNRAFVLAEYFGYLRRNPNDAPETTMDYTGYDFWLAKLNQFNGNYINAEMVKAFLSSIEYRQRFGP